MYETVQYQVRAEIRIPNLMAKLHCAEHVQIAQTRIPTPYFCTGQESESFSGNVNEVNKINGRERQPCRFHVFWYTLKGSFILEESESDTVSRWINRIQLNSHIQQQQRSLSPSLLLSVNQA